MESFNLQGAQITVGRALLDRLYLSNWKLLMFWRILGEICLMSFFLLVQHTPHTLLLNSSWVRGSGIISEKKNNLNNINSPKLVVCYVNCLFLLWAVTFISLVLWRRHSALIVNKKHYSYIYSTFNHSIIKQNQSVFNTVTECLKYFHWLSRFGFLWLTQGGWMW